jgi:serine/threonine protein kinase
VTLNSGSRLGPYEIVAVLGAGGMGEVYKARDTRLERPVAIKVLGGVLAADQQFHERFEREARTISQLNHPNICTLHDVGKEESVRFLVMEYLEGETLAARLDVLRAKGKPLPVDEAVAIAIQVADALDVAHRAGIVHRDLKPGNVMLTTAAARPGQPHAKLLDFGLAKTARAPGLPGAGGPAIELAALSAPVTMTSPLTTQGSIVGTVQYMAPEQLEGKEADVRSDVFAFGAVVYEMLTGERAFPGKTLVSLMASILEHEPKLPSSGPAAVPPALARVVQKCLAKDPNRRWQSAGDLADELRWIGDEGGLKLDAPNADAVTTTKRSRLNTIGIVTAALAAGIALTTGTMWIIGQLSAPPAPQPVRFTITPAQDSPLVVPGPDRDIAITPDGRTIVYRVGAVGGGTATGLAVRPLGELETRILVGVTGTRNPFISPDGRWVGYFSGGELKKYRYPEDRPSRCASTPGCPEEQAGVPTMSSSSRRMTIRPGCSPCPLGAASRRR